MADKTKAGDNLNIPAVLVLGAAPQEIIGRPATAGVQFTGGQQAIAIQNRSGADIEISTNALAASGWLLADGQSITINVSDNWDGSIWGVVGAAVTVCVAQLGAR